MPAALEGAQQVLLAHKCRPKMIMTGLAKVEMSS